MLRADDLLVLLEVARCGSLYSAGAALGWNHATVSRRITVLEEEVRGPVIVRTSHGCTLTDLGRGLLEASEQIEQAMADVRDRASRPTNPRSLSGLVRIVAPDGFGVHFIAPALAQIHRANPNLVLELVTATRLGPYGSGADLEVGVGEPLASRGDAVPLCAYELGLYASREYLRNVGEPQSIEDLAQHSFVYYVDSLLPVPELQDIARLFPSRTAQVGSTNVHAHVAATAAGAGIGLLPSFLARRQDELVVLFPAEATVTLQIKMGMAPPKIRRPSTAAVARLVQRAIAARAHELTPQIHQQH